MDEQEIIIPKAATKATVPGPNPGYVAGSPYENATPASAAQLGQLVISAGWGQPTIEANPNGSAGNAGQMLPSNQFSANGIVDPGKFDLVITVPKRGAYNVALCLLMIGNYISQGVSAPNALALTMPVLGLWFG